YNIAKDIALLVDSAIFCFHEASALDESRRSWPTFCVESRAPETWTNR
ncbi:unnamed protein product, partial [Ascophyllum nodosum]